jgi:hypothetical protein
MANLDARSALAPRGNLAGASRGALRGWLVGLGRFELPTNGLGNRCSIHLSYSPINDLRNQRCIIVASSQPSVRFCGLVLDRNFEARLPDRDEMRASHAIARVPRAAG